MSLLCRHCSSLWVSKNKERLKINSTICQVAICAKKRNKPSKRDRRMTGGDGKMPFYTGCLKWRWSTDYTIFGLKLGRWRQVMQKSSWIEIAEDRGKRRQGGSDEEVCLTHLRISKLTCGPRVLFSWLGSVMLREIHWLTELLDFTSLLFVLGFVP